MPTHGGSVCNWKARGGVGGVGSEVTVLTLSLSPSPERPPAPLELCIM